MRFFITFQIDLDKEKNEYGDILQLSIEEGYENLAYKTLAGFAWIWRQYGENLQWIIKLDDDLDLNLDKFLNKLPNKGQLISKWFFGSSISSKKRTKEFNFTTMIPQVDLFSFIGRN